MIKINLLVLLLLYQLGQLLCKCIPYDYPERLHQAFELLVFHSSR